MKPLLSLILIFFSVLSYASEINEKVLICIDEKKYKNKNIAQSDPKKALELLSINVFKDKENYNITLLFKDNAIINLSTEIIELTLEDQKK